MKTSFRLSFPLNSIHTTVISLLFSLEIRYEHWISNLTISKTETLCSCRSVSSPPRVSAHWKSTIAAEKRTMGVWGSGPRSSSSTNGICYTCSHRLSSIWQATPFLTFIFIVNKGTNEIKRKRYNTTKIETYTVNCPLIEKSHWIEIVKWVTIATSSLNQSSVKKTNNKST